ncbi:class I adenylate-forming enzyme family protein [Cellulomonas sp. URHD0024]|uniref:class I adenylate-forming enzyme family protein n=1 Tax=Cellulomonas sp. URHD0024 TaxID=1302620 RepID=UPI000428460F|nr:class I adenylate-forming enzyme family protein [Cellulomonas sp. URHD0024]
MFDLSTLMSGAAKRHPDAQFALDAALDVAPHLGTRLTYATMARVVEHVAAVLHARGVRAGDVVVVHKRANPDILPIACAIGRLGAVPAMLAPKLGRHESDVLIERLGARFLVTSADWYPESPDTIVADEVGADVSAAWASGVPSVPAAPAPGPEDIYLITHTSGTTSVPKLVPQARRGTQMPITVQAAFAAALRYDEPVAMAMSFVHGRTVAAFATALKLGLTTLLISDPTPGNALPLLKEFQPGAIETHPNMAMAWEAELRLDPTPFAKARVIISTFDAIHPRTVRTLMMSSERRSPMFFQSYGQTETGPISMKTYTLRSMLRIDDRCVGRPFPTLTKVKIIDEDGRKVPTGTVGRIAITSKGLGLDYLGEHDRYASNFADGWWLMGDYGSVDRTGQVLIEDRGQDRIPGVPSALRVEDRIINAMSEVRETILVGGAGEQFLVYVPYEGAVVNHDRLLRASGLTQDVHIVPREWDTIPMTSTWKVRRSVLLADLTAEKVGDGVG